ncbi:18608_t:CDS:2, partial [Gigaspora rosea]
MPIHFSFTGSETRNATSENVNKDSSENDELVLQVASLITTLKTLSASNEESNNSHCSNYDEVIIEGLDFEKGEIKSIKKITMRQKDFEPMNDELKAYAKETIRVDGGRWI